MNHKIESLRRAVEFGIRAGKSNVIADLDVLAELFAAADSAVSVSNGRSSAGASPDDLRAVGWAVAVHNDYRLNGEPHTFWLFTNGNRAVKGEGRTDAEALRQVRTAVFDSMAVVPPPARAGDEAR